MLEGFLTPNTIAMVLVVGFVVWLLWRDRDNIERHSIVIIRRTERGITFLDDVASRAPGLWRVWSDVNIVVGFLVMGLIVFFLLYNGLKILMVPEAVPAVGLVLPTTGQATMGPGYFLVPFWHWIVGISTVAVFHEMMHGVIARNEGFPIKSVGWFVLGILPGAFVEPEGEEMFPEETEEDEGSEDDESKDGGITVEGPWGDGDWRGKLRVLAAGSGANLTIALVLVGLMAAMTTGAHGQRDIRGVYEYNGAEVNKVFNQSGAYHAGLEPGTVIQRVDGQKVRNVEEFLAHGDTFTVNETVRLSGVYNGSTFNMSVEIGTKPQTYAYRPAPIDPLLVRVEKRFPGTIDMYEKYNDAFVDGGVRTELERWRWIQENYDGLDDRADAKIDALSDRLEDDVDGFLGVGVRSAKDVKEGMEPIAAGAEFLLTLLFFMVMIHAGVGAANMMPIKPLDGGWMLDTVVNEYLPARRKLLVRSVMAGTLGLFAVNMIVPFLF